MAKRLPTLGGAVWHDDPCVIYCQGNQIDAKAEKPKLTGGATKVCRTLAMGETKKGVEQDGIAYDIHRYNGFSAVPGDMKPILSDGVHVPEDGFFCVMLNAWKVHKEKQYQVPEDTQRACEQLCTKLRKSFGTFKESICMDQACRDEKWRNAVFNPPK